MNRFISALLVLFVAVAVLAQSEAKGKSASKKSGAAKAHTNLVVQAADVKWEDPPPQLPPGAKMAVIEGDPGKAGPYTLRLKTPNGYKVQAHWHPMDEHLTVLSGTFHLGTGDKLDESKGAALPTGSYASMPARMHHYAWSEGETVVQLHGNGPFKITYVNPADDPSKTKK